MNSCELRKAFIELVYELTSRCNNSQENLFRNNKTLQVFLNLLKLPSHFTGYRRKIGGFSYFVALLFLLVSTWNFHLHVYECMHLVIAPILNSW